MYEEDTEENYRRHLAELIAVRSSRRNVRHYGRLINNCKIKAAERYPVGAAAAERKDVAAVGILGALGLFLSKLFG